MEEMQLAGSTAGVGLKLVMDVRNAHSSGETLEVGCKLYRLTSRSRWRSFGAISGGAQWMNWY